MSDRLLQKVRTPDPEFGVHLSGDRGTIALGPQRLHATGRFLQTRSTSDRPPDGPHPNCLAKRVSPNIALLME
ncbi:hypothetical protein NG798_23135 [Ancylothrix sp. C2]|uniref:hypothetical protein n=1 Tax=Ancylothrix sp. D3o TaxID=2953691 RepID=UPI0021BB43D2|nr:hypothetical protein [Ancylothrix sp. D3o]MCT7952698.1 hypothetical protein [Ancylothrix sp. D3o]